MLLTLSLLHLFSKQANAPSQPLWTSKVADTERRSFYVHYSTVDTGKKSPKLVPWNWRRPTRLVGLANLNLITFIIFKHKKKADNIFFFFLTRLWNCTWCLTTFLLSWSPKLLGPLVVRATENEFVQTRGSTMHAERSNHLLSNNNEMAKKDSNPRNGAANVNIAHDTVPKSTELRFTLGTDAVDAYKRTAPIQWHQKYNVIVFPMFLYVFHHC